jgi:hypothetical protein
MAQCGGAQKIAVRASACDAQGASSIRFATHAVSYDARYGAAQQNTRSIELRIDKENRASTAIKLRGKRVLS